MEVEKRKIKNALVFTIKTVSRLYICCKTSDHCTALQLIESLQREIDLRGVCVGVVDTGKVNRQVVLQVGYFPARAAVRGTIRSVGSAANERKAGNGVQLWVYRDKVCARKALE